MIEIYTDATKDTIGFLAYDDDGLVHWDSDDIEAVSTNVAEYMAMLAALEWAEQADIWGHEVKFHSDSELMVRQIKGRYRCKSSHLAHFCAEAKEYFQRHPHFKLKHIPGKENPADKLVRGKIYGKA